MEVSAVVLKSHQEKDAALRARIEIVDARKGYLLETRPLLVENHFLHDAQTFVGDARALDPNERTQESLLPFPSDASMLVAVAEMVSPAIASELEKSRYL